MSTWADLSLDSIAAAKTMHPQGRYRSCISRCYYAAFSAATEELAKVKNIRFEYGRDHPTHRQLPGLARRHLVGRLRSWDLPRLVSALRRLYAARIDADYVRSATIDEELVRNILRDAHTVLRALGAIT